jgi:hypothetical protein
VLRRSNIQSKLGESRAYGRSLSARTIVAPFSLATTFFGVPVGAKKRGIESWHAALTRGWNFRHSQGATRREVCCSSLQVRQHDSGLRGHQINLLSQQIRHWGPSTNACTGQMLQQLARQLCASETSVTFPGFAFIKVTRLLKLFTGKLFCRPLD